MTNKSNITYNEKTVYSTFKNLPMLREQAYYTSNFDVIDTIVDMDILLKRAKLTKTQREAFNLYFIQGYTYEEIAKKQGYTTQATFNNIKRSKDKIRRVLKIWGEVATDEQVSK